MELTSVKILNTEYFIDRDDCQFIVRVKSVVSDEKSKNYGKEYFDTVGYFSTMKSLLIFFKEHKLRKTVFSKNLENFLEELEKTNKFIEKIAKEIGAKFYD